MLILIFLCFYLIWGNFVAWFTLNTLITICQFNSYFVFDRVDITLFYIIIMLFYPIVCIAYLMNRKYIDDIDLIELGVLIKYKLGRLK